MREYKSVPRKEPNVMESRFGVGDTDVAYIKLRKGFVFPRINLLIIVSFVLMAFIQAVRAMDFAPLTRPSTVLVDEMPAGIRVSISEDGVVTLKGGTASFVRMRWDGNLGGVTHVCGSMWERTYGDSEWRRTDDPTAPRGGAMAWYFLATDGIRTDGYGVKVQPNAFARWKVNPAEIELLLDVRAGSCPVELGSREVRLCTLVARRGVPGESPFAAGRAFCRLMCPQPRLPKSAVYGYNDWYCAYGHNTATNFLEDARTLVNLMDSQPGPRVLNRPFVVVDDGWQLNERRGDIVGRDGLWTTNNVRWGMDMRTFCAQVKAMDARPGLWYRPLMPWASMPIGMRTSGETAKVWKGGFLVDPTSPGLVEQIKADLVRFRSWGIELVKIDFITFDWNTVWGFELGDSPIQHGKAIWKDRSRTSAEVVRELYVAMREGAGDMYIIGCNAIDHFAAGLFELQRTGDDTDGRGWARTRKMGPNTLGMRAIHNNIFYLNDGDCVGLVNRDSIPWQLNKQWLDLVAVSGTALFTSWKRALAKDPDVAQALGRAWKYASMGPDTAEPLDWLETPRPRRWRIGDGSIRVYDWDTGFKED